MYKIVHSQVFNKFADREKRIQKNKMNTYSIFLLIFIVLIQSGFAQTDYDRLEAEIINTEKTIVAKLTGHEPIKGRKKLSSRASDSERKVTADYMYNS